MAHRSLHQASKASPERHEMLQLQLGASRGEQQGAEVTIRSGSVELEARRVDHSKGAIYVTYAGGYLRPGRDAVVSLSRATIRARIVWTREENGAKHSMLYLLSKKH